MHILGWFNIFSFSTLLYLRDQSQSAATAQSAALASTTVAAASYVAAVLHGHVFRVSRLLDSRRRRR
jgi:hypothetical protein